MKPRERSRFPRISIVSWSQWPPCTSQWPGTFLAYFNGLYETIFWSPHKDIHTAYTDFKFVLQYNKFCLLITWAHTLPRLFVFEFQPHCDLLEIQLQPQSAKPRLWPRPRLPPKLSLHQRPKSLAWAQDAASAEGMAAANRASPISGARFIQVEQRGSSIWQQQVKPFVTSHHWSLAGGD